MSDSKSGKVVCGRGKAIKPTLRRGEKGSGWRWVPKKIQSQPEIKIYPAVDWQPGYSYKTYASWYNGERDADYDAVTFERWHKSTANSTTLTDFILDKLVDYYKKTQGTLVIEKEHGMDKIRIVHHRDFGGGDEVSYHFQVCLDDWPPKEVEILICLVTKKIPLPACDAEEDIDLEDANCSEESPVPEEVVIPASAPTEIKAAVPPEEDKHSYSSTLIWGEDGDYESAVLTRATIDGDGAKALMSEIIKTLSEYPTKHYARGELSITTNLSGQAKIQMSDYRHCGSFCVNLKDWPAQQLAELLEEVRQKVPATYE